MKNKYYFLVYGLIILTTSVFSQDFIPTQTYVELDFNSIRTYNQNKVTDFKLDPIIREKLMPYYQDAIKQLKVAREVHFTISRDNSNNETVLDSAVFNYDINGKLTSITVKGPKDKKGSKGISLFFDYDKTGNLSKIRGDKKTIRTFTRDKNGKISKADKISYIYENGALKKIGKIYKDGDYFIDDCSSDNFFDRYETKYDQFGRIWEFSAHEAISEYFYDANKRLAMNKGGAESYHYSISIYYEGDLMTQITESNGYATDEDSETLILTEIRRTYRN